MCLCVCVCVCAFALIGDAIRRLRRCTPCVRLYNSERAKTIIYRRGITRLFIQLNSVNCCTTVRIKEAQLLQRDRATCYVGKFVLRFQTSKVTFEVIQAFKGTGNVPFDKPHAISYSCSIATMSLSCTVSDILSLISQNLKRSRNLNTSLSNVIYHACAITPVYQSAHEI